MASLATSCRCVDRHERKLRDMMTGVRVLAIVLIFITACGGRHVGGTAAKQQQVAAPTVFPAARFVPAEPMYVVSAKTMRDAQVALTDLADIVGLAVGAEPKDASRALSMLLGIDLLSAEAASGIGIDLQGSIVVFSEDGTPTFVVHLSAPDAMNAYIESQRSQGMRTQSVVVAGTEVFTTKLPMGGAHVSWAIDKDWLWVHFTGDAPKDTSWFEHSKTPAPAKWVDGWTWAQALSNNAANVVGVFRPQGALAMAAAAAPNAVECLRKLEAIQRVGFTMETDGKRIAGTLAFELGAAATTDLQKTVLAPPPGWVTAGANAPMSAQVNLDLKVAASWVQSCMAKFDASGNRIGGGPDLVGMLDQYGVRTARAFVHSFDPGEKSGTGAVSLDLSNAKFFRAQLDDIPGRSAFERSRTFGVYKGKHVSVPFVGAGDYVLDDHVAIAAMGDGLLAKIGTQGAAGDAPPLLSIDLRPPGMSASVWEWLLAQLELPNPKRFAQRLMTWSELHVGARIAGDRMLVEAAGNRR
jgi:hypothetical protein